MVKAATRERVAPEFVQPMNSVDDRDPQVPVTMYSASPELMAVLVMANKAYGFDLIMQLRDQLATVEIEIKALQKSTARNQGSILSQRLGEASRIRHTIDLVFESLRGR